jgi:hypothetical protein
MRLLGCGDRPEAESRRSRGPMMTAAIQPGTRPTPTRLIKSRGHEKLVGDRVEKLPEGGDFIRPAGQQPVYGIGKSGEDEDAESGPLVPLKIDEQTEHEKGDQEDPQRCQRIR